MPSVVVGGGTSEPLIIGVVEEEKFDRLDKTFGEIKESFYSGKQIWLRVDGDSVYYYPISRLEPTTSGGGSVAFANNSKYGAETDADYPISGSNNP